MNIWPAVAALIPSIGVGLLFWLAMRAVIRADRTERAAMARMDAEDAAAGRVVASTAVAEASARAANPSSGGDDNSENATTDSARNA
ncbi:hypothetical protein GCM10025865_19130 [Paraoerskovia sediminicola]|uniref:Lysyl-tRNA synthetase n=1 Tax=Paraoerskovia sediminicola TaxID=1138587 RepID=A0ABN6XCL1_9CELL|nr:hypothetical protein [Paraoerskovia sediminicola]BDZ42614.1 hypothetical protein GCM10025865_19130 [Paraoerskovia sediminicola]